MVLIAVVSAFCARSFHPLRMVVNRLFGGRLSFVLRHGYMRKKVDLEQS
ncbi:hypothetical protein GA0061078_1141 [Bifidobacterium bohemicum]|uniref:Uncharacterized protein n=1 Tax=Bifidobacterium bohemicum DSM 22767 TaxID=1437606 RepID=A0A086ZGG7_9BIFI|nr:hypothetical protein BBOH_0970 [Bifidobacterium bohemicum DSM 22767]SCC00504.1 hypothetical protein GA0061078_1141 [Bifidobacterium bohemicum]